MPRRLASIAFVAVAAVANLLVMLLLMAISLWLLLAFAGSLSAGLLALSALILFVVVAVVTYWLYRWALRRITARHPRLATLVYGIRADNGKAATHDSQATS